VNKLARFGVAILATLMIALGIIVIAVLLSGH
jgi:hypothetical protein